MLNPQEHVLDYVDDFLHQALAPVDADIVEEHCERCSICQAALEEARRRAEAFKALPPSEAPERLVQQTVEKVAMYSSKRSTAWKILTRSVADRDEAGNTASLFELTSNQMTGALGCNK